MIAFGFQQVVTWVMVAVLVFAAMVLLALIGLLGMAHLMGRGAGRVETASSGRGAWWRSTDRWLVTAVAPLTAAVLLALFVFALADSSEIRQ